MKRKAAQLIAGKILPALRVFVYNRGFRPKPGNPLFSGPLSIAFAYKDAVDKIRHLRK